MKIPASLKQKMYVVVALGALSPTQAEAQSAANSDSSSNSEYANRPIPRGLRSSYERPEPRFRELKRMLERRAAANGPTANSSDSAWSAQHSSRTGQQATPVGRAGTSTGSKLSKTGAPISSGKATTTAGTKGVVSPNAGETPLPGLQNALEQSDQRIPKLKDPCYGCGRG